MTLADLSSARAEEQAVEEFDRLGRDAFLEKYGFGRARQYFLELDGRRYDSKAIVGAAHGFAFLRMGRCERLTSVAARQLSEPNSKNLAANPGAGAIQRQCRVRPREPKEGVSSADDRHYKAAKSEAHYNASRFLAMVNEHGGLEAAQTLLRAAAMSEGYTALGDRQRLDLTVEAVILEKKWWPLFTDAERRAAVRRLRDYQYSGPLPDL